MHALSVLGTDDALQRENAELRRQLTIAREAHAVMTLQIAQLEKLAREINRAAVKHPHQPLSRWVKFGPMAILLASITDMSNSMTPVFPQTFTSEELKAAMCFDSPPCVGVAKPLSDQEGQA